jgi:hypothetical protein
VLAQTQGQVIGDGSLETGAEVVPTADCRVQLNEVVRQGVDEEADWVRCMRPATQTAIIK